MRARWRIYVLLFVIALTVGGLVLAFAIFNPTPPRTVTFAAGPEGGSNWEFADEYRRIFADNGIELRLVQTEGTIENLRLIADGDSGVDAAFLSMGTSRGELHGVESLGGMFLEPLWLFHRDLNLVDGILVNLAGSTLSIGPSGSAGNAAAQIVFALNGIDAADIDIVELRASEAARALIAGEIDAVIISSSVTSEVITELLGNPEITLQTFGRADAYTALFPALTKLVVPAGLGNLADNVPPRDTEILAYTAIIGVREDLHSAIQSLLLEAASQVHGRPDAFHAYGQFPAPVSYHLPLSKSATRFYQSGQPFLQRYLPFWLAILMMQIFVAAIPIIGVLYPAARLLPPFFNWTMRRRIFRLYSGLRRVEFEAATSNLEETCDKLLDDLDKLDRKVRQLRLPLSFMHLSYNLRSHINIVRSRILLRTKQVDPLSS